MSHMVIYRGADGKPGYHQTDDIHDAVGFVEQMRNDEGVEHARIFRLEEVVFEYRPYYRVELSAAGTPMTLNASSSAPQLPEADGPATIAIPTGAPPAAENGSLASAVNEAMSGSPANGAATGAPVNGAINGAAGVESGSSGAVTGNGQPIEPIDIADEVIDIADQPEERQPKAEAGSGKKGLFGR